MRIRVLAVGLAACVVALGVRPGAGGEARGQLRGPGELVPAGPPRLPPGPPAGPLRGFPPDRPVTDADVTRAIELGREYLLNLRNGDGSFTREGPWRNCYTALILMTLAYMGEHPNRDVMSRGMQYLLNLSPDRDFGGREGYALPIRVMALAYLHDKLTDERRATARKVMASDLNHIIRGQNAAGGWRYQFNRADADFSVTQWQLLAMYEAGRVGIEFPKEPLLAARAFYFQGQMDDGGWSYQPILRTSYGSMTAAGLASLQIISDLVEPASGCPCKDGRSQRLGSETERRMDAALAWLTKNFTVANNPGWPHQTGTDEVYYWLYCLERVGIATGYKHFGGRNWYKEGARYLLSRQMTDGSWAQTGPGTRARTRDWAGGSVPDTCFAVLFLYKGRAPVLFNKLRFAGTWNPHRRDVANLTRYIEWSKEQQFHWQIVDLAAPLEELHDAPLLYVSAESVPAWSDDEKRKLRAFTDTGGTILLEASCGNPPVRDWARKFAREVWPEWPLAPLRADHPVFADPYPLKQRPELMGISDGLRTVLYYAMDDVSCPWHMRAFAGKEYLFKWGINLFTCATDRAPLRAKLAGTPPEEAARYTAAPRPGPRTRLRLARLRTDGDWHVGANYGAFARLADYLKPLGVTLTVAGESAAPVTAGGVRPADLLDGDAAYLTGTTPFTLGDDARKALQAWVSGGGFLWAEAALGSTDFDKSLRALAAQAGWTLKLLPNDHPLMTGRMGPASGYDLTAGVAFRRALRVSRAARPQADLYGLFQGDKMVGLYSPFDVLFSTSPYEAYGCRGYKTADAGAVVTNILLYLTAPGGAAPAKPDREGPAAPEPKPVQPGPKKPPKRTPAPGEAVPWW